MGNSEVLTRSACLVRYGRLGWVGLFSATDELEAEHGDSVVIQTDRGQELGELLSSVAEHHVGDVSPSGDVLRLAGREWARERIQPVAKPHPFE